MKKVRYPPEISRPAVLVRPKGFAVPDTTIPEREAIEHENSEMLRLRDEAIVQKLRLLMDHYGIKNKDDWFALARVLAFEHVKGLEQSVDQLFSLKVIPESDSCADSLAGLVPFNKKRSGRSLEWPTERLLELLEVVKTEKTKYGWSKDLRALEHLARSRKWGRPTNHRGDLQAWIRTLQNRLQDAKAFERWVAKQRKVLQQIAQQMTQEKSRKF
jgi:hypothetical protein